MKSSLTLIKITLIVVSSLFFLECKQQNATSDTGDTDSLNLDTLTIIYDANEVKKCEQRVEEQVKEIDKRYDTILEILEQQIDSVEFRKIVNKKSLNYDKQQKIRLKDLLRKIKRKKDRKNKKDGGY